jgi:hypothetical protein
MHMGRQIMELVHIKHYHFATVEDLSRILDDIPMTAEFRSDSDDSLYIEEYPTDEHPRYRLGD